MLYGRYPFWSISFEDIQVQTIECKPDYGGKNVSEQAIDLLKNMIAYQRFRVSCVDALKHPWLNPKSHSYSRTNECRSTGKNRIKK